MVDEDGKQRWRLANQAFSPALYGDAIGTARFKSQSDDFQVEEILGIEPTGEGEHCLVWVEKTERNTNDVATDFAKKLGVRKRLVSHCGMKDKNGVTRQWFSLHLPGRESPTAGLLDSPGVRVLKITRHIRKLHRGAHDGNRFVVRLRDCQFTAIDAEQRWAKICERGVPNYFGPQRFGANGDNVRNAVRFMTGKLEVKDRMLRGILISAARSSVFNACIARRLQMGTWDTALDGEVFGFSDNRSLVLPHNLRGDEADRVHNGDLELTAPLWGLGELQSLGEVRKIELQVAEENAEIISGLEQFNLKQERRVMRLKPLAPQMKWESDKTLILGFELPKGTYATTLLKELVRVI